LKALDFVLDKPSPAAVVKDVLYPNIAIQFLGWLDQSKTDFGKGRSRALEAVKRALEDNGLAIPDPITHVRMEASERPAQPAPAPSQPRGREDGDVAPERAVTQMVEKERAEAPDKKDLLDPSRPQE
jgi:small-conductance mechanosensitive channel